MPLNNRAMGWNLVDFSNIRKAAFESTPIWIISETEAQSIDMDEYEHTTMDTQYNSAYSLNNTEVTWLSGIQV